MRWILLLVTAWITLPGAALRASDAELDEFFKLPKMLDQVRDVGLVMLAQGDDQVADKALEQAKNVFWASNPAADLPPAEKQLAIAEFERQWSVLEQAIRVRKLRTLSFAGLDYVCLRRCMNWYYAGFSPQGPVLIRVSLCFYDDGPPRFFAFEVISDWNAIQKAQAAIQISAERKVMNINYKGKTEQSKDNET